jgi:hypothetical protein
MSVQIVCDGCGDKLLYEPPAEFGHIRTAQYCLRCKESVESFITARNDLHTYLAKQWTRGVEVLKEAWLRDHPGGRLPDE